MSANRGGRKAIELTLTLIAVSSIAILFVITFFIFKEGLPFILEVGPGKMLGSLDWAPTKGRFGLLPMIVGSLLVTGGALALGVPLGLSCAIFLVEFSKPRVRRVLKPAIELLAGIPSVVYGFLGVVFLVPLIRTQLGGPGLSLLAGALILGVMILPTVISISMDALEAVPRSYREGSLALGATTAQTVNKVVLPAARSGIVTAVVLGMGRAIGETMAVIMVTGNALDLPRSPLDPIRTLTSNIALELGYAAGKHQQALFATGVILFVMIMILNLIATATSRRRARR
ncbi:MAG TPA: phosphate ABC transporter permease subunit PstC [bacterium]